MKKQSVMVAMSGGVDSSVAAYLLKEQGYEVAGLTMHTGVDEKYKKGEISTSEKDQHDAAEVCKLLKIPHHILDFSKEIEEMVIGPFISEYETGRTPNPCVRCNRQLKFGLLIDKSFELGYDMVATGHYAGIAFANDKYFLKKPVDVNKDQTYFLYAIDRTKLANVLFPLADYTKNSIREIAEKAKFPVSDKSDSQDVCFFPEGGSAEFFRNCGKKGVPGDIINTNGEVVGRHKGIIFYTIGQRRGLGISSENPLYVISIDTVNNRIVAGEKNLLLSKRLIAGDVRFFSDDKSGVAHGKIRYAHKPARCSYKIEDDKLEVIFDEFQEAITPGQSVVLYDDDILLGGAIIEKAI